MAVRNERDACAKIAADLHTSALADLDKAVTEDAKLMHDVRQAVTGYIADAIRKRTVAAATV